jgi:hypothetical protein
VTLTSATLAGSVNPRATDTSVIFQYGTTTSYGSTTTGLDEGQGITSENFTQSVQGLNPSTLYHYRAVASNLNGTVYGTDKTFSTLPLQTVGPSPQAYLSASGVQVGYTVATDGLPTTVYLQYGTDTTYGSVTPTVKLSGSGVAANLLTLLSGLAPNTTYDYQIVTQSANGQVVSANQTFTTPPFQETSVATVSKTTTAAVGSNYNYASLGHPVVNDGGYSAYRAVLKVGSGVTAASEVGIWADDPNGDLQLVAQTGSGAAQGTTAPYTALDDPVYNDNNAVAFIGTLKVGSGLATSATSVGVWSNSSGNLSLVAQTGTQAPDCPTGVTFAGFSQIALPDANGVILLGVLTPNRALGVTSASDIGIWAVDGSNNLHLIVRTGQELGGKTVTALSFMSSLAPVLGQSRAFSPSTGEVTFLATFSDRTTGIYDASSAASISPVALSAGAAPGLSGPTFASFGIPAINGNGNNAFRAILASGSGVTAANDEGIWADNGSGLQLVAQIGGTTAAPGTTAPFTALSDPVYNDNNDVAFVGTLKVGTGLATAATKSGVWSSSSGSLALVAQTGTHAPGCPTGVLFSGFSEIALPDEDGVLFLGTLTPNSALGVTSASDLGIWATDSSGNLQLIVRTGDTLNGKTVSNLAFLPTVATVTGQSRSFALDGENNSYITFVADFTDGTSGIFTVSFQ